MPANFEQESIDAREEFNNLYKPGYSEIEQVTWFAFDATVSVPSTSLITQVFKEGLIQRDGDTEDYVVADDSYNQTITFAVAPTTLDVAVYTRTKI